VYYMPESSGQKVLLDATTTTAEPSVNPYSKVGALWCPVCGCFTLPIENGKCAWCSNWIVFKSCRMDKDAVTEEIPTTS
jgi:hypothetical protein